MEGINRTDEDEEVATARVHAVVSDRSVREIEEDAFDARVNLFKVTAPFVEEWERMLLGGLITCATWLSLPM